MIWRSKVWQENGQRYAPAVFCARIFAMKRKHYILVTAVLIMVIVLFFVYNNAQSKKITCSPEGMNPNCEVRRNFNIVLDKFINESIDKSESNVISTKNSCSNYFNDFAKKNDEYYENIQAKNPELKFNESEYICRDGDEGILVYYKYRIGNKGAFCYDGSSINKQVFKVPEGYSCEE